MKNAAATQALRDYGKARSEETRHRIQTAIRAMRKDKTPISINAVAHRAGVSRSTIYRHHDLLQAITALRGTTARHPQPAQASSDGSTLLDALRHQLRQLQVQHRKEVAALKASLKERDQALAAADGEIHRLTQTLPPMPPAATD
jgi:ribosomal 50S subunit-associated protein YjgA (DUF615 family)